MKENTFAEILKKAREAKGLSYARLAKEIGVSHGLLFHYEAHKKYPSRAVLRKICDTLGIDLNSAYLLIQQEKAPKEAKHLFNPDKFLKENNQNTFGTLIKSERIRRHLTSRKFTSQLDVSVTALYKFEKSLAFPSQQVLKKICKILDLDFNLMSSKIHLDKAHPEIREQLKKSQFCKRCEITEDGLSVKSIRELLQSKSNEYECLSKIRTDNGELFAGAIIQERKRTIDWIVNNVLSGRVFGLEATKNNES